MHLAPFRNNNNHNHERIRTLEELVSRDNGGMIFSPQVGLHENVVALDYDSEYANLIVNHNLSYETVTLQDGVVDVQQSNDNKKGLLPTVVEIQVVDVLCKETGLSRSIDYDYKFLVLLPLEADENIDALKHYYGITQQGELVVRGMEIRRHDIPNFIKQFQTELLYTLFDCKDRSEVVSKGYENCLLLVTKAIDKIMTGEEIHQQDLVISKLLRQDIEKYKSLFPNVSAAIQLSNKGGGKYPTKGDAIQYIYTNSQHKDPLCRVVPLEILQKGEKDGKGDNSIVNYDKEKYREMILDAAETVLGFFGFDRTVYRNPRKNRKRKWWQELHEEKRYPNRDDDGKTITQNWKMLNYTAGIYR